MTPGQERGRVGGRGSRRRRLVPSGGAILLALAAVACGGQGSTAGSGSPAAVPTTAAPTPPATAAPVSPPTTTPSTIVAPLPGLALTLAGVAAGVTPAPSPAAPGATTYRVDAANTHVLDVTAMVAAHLSGSDQDLSLEGFVAAYQVRYTSTLEYVQVTLMQFQQASGAQLASTALSASIGSSPGTTTAPPPAGLGSLAAAFRAPAQRTSEHAGVVLWADRNLLTEVLVVGSAADPLPRALAVAHLQDAVLAAH